MGKEREEKRIRGEKNVERTWRENEERREMERRNLERRNVERRDAERVRR